MNILANDFVRVFTSPDPDTIYTYSPGITVLPGGRLIATLDLGGPGVKNLRGEKGIRYDKPVQGKAFISDDHGKTWQHVLDFPFMMARPFIAGNSLYIIGLAGDLMIIVSDDQGQTWSETVKLTDHQQWCQAPCNVHYAKGCVYLVMVRRPYDVDPALWYSTHAPVLMRGKTTDDLSRREHWAFASELVFRETVQQDKMNYFGVPFFNPSSQQAIHVGQGRRCVPMGWQEPNVIQIKDPDHYWYDPEESTFHLIMRAHTGGSGYAAIAKVVEQPDGTMQTMLETAPSGKKMVYVPCPGGQMKFHILYDQLTQLFWLLSTQATDSMTRADRLPPERYNLPNNERRRLQLHFSKNCIDWCFAGIVAQGDTEKQSRHYASMVIEGDDLHILSRSGDENAFDAHQTNFISYHTIRNFRNLIY